MTRLHIGWYYVWKESQRFRRLTASNIGVYIDTHTHTHTPTHTQAKAGAYIYIYILATCLGACMCTRFRLYIGVLRSAKSCWDTYMNRFAPAFKMLCALVPVLRAIWMIYSEDEYSPWLFRLSVDIDLLKSLFWKKSYRLFPKENCLFYSY